MTTNNETDRKKLSLSGKGKLSLGKSADTDQVKQSFSHGRSKTVQVERRRKRVGGPGGIGGDAAGLSAEERERRTRALKEGLRQQEEAATAAAAAAPQAPAAEVVAEAAPEPAPAPEPLDRRQAELEEMRKIAEAEGRVRDEEAARLAEEAAAREAKAKAEEAAARPAETRNAPRNTPAARAADPAQPAPAGDDDADGRRPKRRSGGAPATPDRRPAPTPNRRGEQRRRSGKLTVSQALDDRGGERSRSLASVRRAREREKQRLREEGGDQAKQIRDVIIPDAITVQELANRMAERAGDVIKTLMKMGMMATITQSIDSDTAELVVAEFGHRSKRVSESDVERQLQGKDDAPEDMLPRAPIVTVMGHVDHGKTSLLDALRRSDVAGGEAGGITQHIGAYQVTVPSGAKITFLDTPGHEAFTEMRARGANVTDIVVLVVAADDGIMAQTVEAIRHAKAAGCPIIVAVNKCDLPDSDPSRVRQELLQHEIVVEEMGGDVLAVDVSAKTKVGLDKLEEAILLQAEVLEVKANPDRRAEGAVIEAKMEKGRGSVATVLVTKGTLNVGDIFVAGAEWGRVRALLDDRGQRTDNAGPSIPVEVLGLQGTPVAGDEFAVVETEGQAREIAEYRQRVLREKSAVAGARGSVEQMLSAIAAGQAEELPVVIKTDVHGSLEAIRSTLENISNDHVAVRILHGAVGGISESDVALAKASSALIIGFNVRANPQARDMAQQEGLEIRYYSIIYELIDDIKAALTGMLSPDLKEEFLGNAEIREVFNITKVGKVGGCMVTEGMLRRAAKVRLLRDSVVIHEGTLKTLKRFKDEVKEVREGYECGAAFENYNDIQAGDLIECFEIKEVARSLESVQRASTSS
ncbi:translation initiation factor IF-2 [uncultured Nisaea sp.]|jgi:translation initiation factor IF-2|uniref:translation initiation factor IF-2 n=1 Tax=uncultured Nisaea sp. TaxID=538215 RepID=UPI0030EDCBEE|tara:strand:+ start:6357 stop:8960 length:2604 start_codon:yes stop_codon:yes gene_type:complete